MSDISRCQKWAIYLSLLVISAALMTISFSLRARADTYLVEDFESYIPGDSPPGWVDQAADFTTGDYFQVLEVDGQMSYGPIDGLYRYSHYNGPGALSWQDYEVTGRLRFGHPEDGISLTFYSQFPAGQDRYYQLLRYSYESGFRIHAHGTQITDGTTSMDVAAQADTWYRFRLQVETLSDRVTIKAKVWEAGQPEPDNWGIDCYDGNAGRITAGTVGIWSEGYATRAADDLQVTPLGAGPTPTPASTPTATDTPTPTPTPTGPTPTPTATPMSSQPDLDEDFESYIPGDSPPDWVDQAADFTTGDHFQVLEVDGQMSYGPIDGLYRYSHYNGLGALSWQDYEVTGRLRFGHPEDGISLTFYSQFPAGQDRYYQLLRYSYESGFRIHAHGTDISEGITSVDVNAQPDTWYRFRLRVHTASDRVRIVAKVWAEGQSEPSNWQIDCYDGNATRLTAGTVGIWSQGSGVRAADDLRVQSLDLPPLTDFPLGLYDVQSAGFDTVQAAGFDQVHIYDSAQTEGNAIAYLQAAAGTGLDVVQNMPSDFLDYAESFWAGRIDALSPYNALSVWYLPEEPTDHNAIERLHDLVRLRDPASRPAGTYFADLTTLNQWCDVVDVLFTGAYPEYSGQPRASMMARLDIAQEACPGVPIIGVPMLFDTNFDGTGDYPTPHEARADAYTALIAGAWGLQWYSYAHSQNLPDLWQAVQDIATELNSLKPVISAADNISPAQIQILSGPLQSPETSGRTYDSIQLLQKDYQGDIYLFAVNLATDTVVAEFSGLPVGYGQADVVFEGRTLPVTDGTFSDTFVEAEVHVYQVTAMATPTSTPTPTATPTPSDSFHLDSPYTGGSFQYTGQLHTHSAGTGGETEPSVMETAYRDAGYGFVALTGHNAFVPDPGVTGILHLGNSEEHIPDYGHMVALGIQTLIPLDYDAQQSIDHINGQGGVAILAHPNWSDPSWDDTELTTLTDYHAIEVKNGYVIHQEGTSNGTALAEWDMLLSGGRRIWGVGVDDAHNLETGGGIFDSYAVRVFSQLSVIEQEDLKSSLKSGNFYTVTGADGPRVEQVSVAGTTVNLTLEDAASTYTVFWYGNNGVLLETDSNVDTQANYTANGTENYIRAEVQRDSDNEHAWLNPIFILGSPPTATPTPTGTPPTATPTGTNTPTPTPTPTPGAGIYLQEDFEAYGSGTNPPDWLDQDSALNVGDFYQVQTVGDSQALTLIDYRDKWLYSHFAGVDATAWQDYEVSGRLNFATATGSGGVTFYSKVPDGQDSWYLLLRYANENQFRIYTHGTSISDCLHGSYIPATIIPGNWYWFRVQVETLSDRVLIRARVWEEGQPEPSDWPLDCYNARSSRLTAGTVGFWTEVGGGQVAMDDLLVRSLAGPPPTPTTTSTPTPTGTPTPTATNTPLPTSTPTPTITPTPTTTSTPTPTGTPTPTATNTPLPTSTPTPTITPTPTNTSTPTPSPTPVQGLQFETTMVFNVDSSYVPVNLQNTYISPIVVCTVNYANNSIPVVTRINNVTSTSFDVRLQNPGDVSSVSPETIHCLVMEEGAWTLPDGRKAEAQKYTSTVTDHNASWAGEGQTYVNSYTNPVVLGQVMSENDNNWSVFWSYGNTRTSPPSATALNVGKTVAEDPNIARADEVVGFIVIEQGFGAMDGVKYEAALGADTIRGVGNAPPYNYTFSQSFTGSPAVAIASLTGMDGNNGGWAYLYGASSLSSTQIGLAIDEDQVSDPERNHTTEQVSYLVFETPVIYTASTSP